MPFLSVFFVFHRKGLVLLNLISRYMTSTIFEKQRHCGPINFCISKLFIQCDTRSCCVTGGVNIYLYVSVSLLVLCVLCVYLCVCLSVRYIKLEY